MLCPNGYTSKVGVTEKWVNTPEGRRKACWGGGKSREVWGFVGPRVEKRMQLLKWWEQ